MRVTPVLEKWIHTAEKGRNYLFQVQISSLFFFEKYLGPENSNGFSRHPPGLSNRSGWVNSVEEIQSEPERPVRLMIRNCRYSQADPELIRKVFKDDRRRQRRFRHYLKSGAEGHLLYTAEGWVGYLWTIRIPFRKKGENYRPEPGRFTAIPRNYPIQGPIAFLSFAGEVHPAYRGKGAFLYLIERSYREIRSIFPEAWIYSNVEIDNGASLKTKLKKGEKPIGQYRALHLRILGRHTGAIYAGKLRTGNLNVKDLAAEHKRRQAGISVR